MSFKGNKKSNVYDSQAGYDLYASYYDESLGYLNSFEKDQLFIILDDVKDLNVLDLGCGTGRMVESLRKFGAKVTGVDHSEKMLQIARKKFPDTEFINADAESLPFADNTFDMVIATFLIVHFQELDPLFREIYRVLKDGGKFILTNINQRKAPKLKLTSKNKSTQEIVIKSHYHRPQDVLTALTDNFFDPEKEVFVQDEGEWFTQILRAKK